ncbi:MAG: ABC-F family ATP-binding cassette domain-containing protein [Deltaproteobacteria bacterium]|nr:ABC-F family ATP-binding cassette domain-containing protein [Deltaproteobacteria bacterium]
MPVIDCQKLLKTYGHRTILAGVSLTIRRGERVGLVGDSGCGKSTLGRVLGGVEPSDGGEISRRRGTRIDILEQEPRFEDGQSVRDIVLGSLVEWSAAKQSYDEITRALSDASERDLDDLIHRQAAAGETVERFGGWERMHEAEAIVDHLGIRDAERKIETLSGGERRRVALARLLVGEPDLAILDEPTNHLDIATIEWLEEHLRERFRGALLLITHDRYVLDHVATRTLELHDGVLTSYDGGYAKYLEAKAERQAHGERVERNRQNFLRRELEWLRRGPKARGTKQKARIGRALDALSQEGPSQQRTADIRADSTRQGKTILHVSNLSLERDGRVLVDGLDLDLTRGERIGIVGPNGTGKTSLLLCLQGELAASGGHFELGSNTRIGYLDQGRAGLDDGETLRDAVVGDREFIEIGGERIRAGAYLERFLFDGAAQRKKVGVLSGGERSRVCLAKLLSEKANLLLLDEPTNDLDVSTLGALEAMLLEYGGSALIVCHDRWFLDRVATSILAFEGDGRVDLHRGNYSEYREKRTAEEKRETAGRRSVAAGDRRKQKPAAKADLAPARKLTFKEQKELDGLFERIEAAEAEAEAIGARLADPETYKGGDVDVSRLGDELEAARELAVELTTRWEELEARKDATSR